MPTDRKRNLSALWWADASDNNTIDISGLPPGQHKVKVQLVGADHNVFPGQVVTLPFTVPDHDREKVYDTTTEAAQPNSKARRGNIDVEINLINS